jgi:diguanylate cyclase (GGDEF)-like protein
MDNRKPLRPAFRYAPLQRTAAPVPGVPWWARFWRRLKDASGLPVEDPELAMSLRAALSRQIPLLYATLLSNAVILAVTHFNTAPKWMAAAMPAVLLALSLLRLRVWARRRGHSVDGPEALRQLRQTTAVAAMLGVAFTVWALALFPYGDAYGQCHVEFFMSITVICCLFSLVHLRVAALLLAVVVGVPFSVFFLRSGHPELVAMAINMLIVAVGMILMLLRNYDDFAALVRSSRELARRQAETQRLSDENLRLANLDALTGLPNRRRFFAALGEALAEAQGRGQRLAVAVLDLDRFKGVNDVHGHTAGDRLLTQIGARLKRLTSGSVFIARLGGDEFGVILTDVPDNLPIFTFGSLVKQLLEGPCVVGDRLASISCSIGVAIYPQAGTSGEELFERADYALYHGKQTRRGEVVIFSAEHETRIREAARVEHIFRAADLEAELWVAFQPIVDVVNRRVVAFEALARWQSPELGAVGPDVFIPIAEGTQLVGQLTIVLLGKALAAARHWPSPVGLGFNLSGHDLASPETMAAVRRLVRLGGMPPERIVFEVTETALLRDFDQAAGALQSLRDLGARISLDDFGTGFSSLGYVHRLRLDKIKIDRSFVIDIDTSPTGRAIIKTILALCDNLRLDCVVEGVETESQARAVAALGCRYIQGFFWSPPVNNDSVTRLVEQIAARSISVLPREAAVL